LSRLVARCIIVLGSQEREIRYESGFARAGGTDMRKPSAIRAEPICFS
jgi:hypothetical protein